MKRISRLLLITVFCCGLALTISCQNKEQRIDAVLEKCQAFLDKDDLSGASACYQDAILSNPDEVRQITKAGQDAVFEKCLEFKDEKDFKNAIVCFEGLTEFETNKANVHFNLADSYYEFYKQKQQDKIRPDYELLSRAENSVKMGLEIRSNDIPARVLYALILKKAGKLSEALEQYKILVESKPESSLFWTNLGLLQQKLARNDEAVKSLKKALELKPDNTEALYFLGVSYENSGDIKKAIYFFDKLFNIDPNYDDVEKRLKSLKEKYDKKESVNSRVKTAGN